jgi:hypothetical protein
LGVKARLSEQAQLAQHGGAHLLRLVDQDDGAAIDGAEMIEPTCSQGFEAAPAVGDADGDTEDVTELAVEVAQAALWVVDNADGQIG